jgi:ribosomal protein S6E (S10)
MPLEQVMQIVNDALSNAAQQPELPDDGESYQHEQQEAMQPQFEQDEMMLSDDGQMIDEQIAMDMGGGIDVSQLEQLPDVQQEQSFD